MVENVGLEKVVEAAQVVIVGDQQHLGPASSSLQFFSKKNISWENKLIAIIFYTNWNLKKQLEPDLTKIFQI